MRERAPAFQFYPRQFAGDDRVMGMDLETIGAHILLMCAAAASPERCRIAYDEYALRMRLRNPSTEAWDRIKKQLLSGAWKISDDGKWWTQSGLERTFLKQKQFSDQQREKANKKWRNEDAEALPDGCRSDAESMPDVMPEVCSSSSSSSSSSKTSSSEQKNDSDEVRVTFPKRRRSNPSHEASRLAALLKSEILRNNPRHRITPAQERQWATTADLMLRLDKRAPEHIAALIQWAQRNEFWRANILSMATLREKFDRLALKRDYANGNAFSGRKVPSITGDAVANTRALLEGGVQ